MATSAFKSTTKRTPISKSTSDSSSSSAHRRSRSLSRFSHRLPPPSEDYPDEAPKGRFVNTVRGSGFPEITLDDLSIQFSGYRGRSELRNEEGSGSERMSASQRRGRSVSRRVSDGKGCGGNDYGAGRVNADANSRRRRSVSVVRYQISDSESDLDHSQNSSNRASSKNCTNGKIRMPVSDKTPASNHKQGLRRSFSQKDLKYHDDYSSHSSVLTDDEVRDAYSIKNGAEKTIRTVYATKKAEHPTADDTNNRLYTAMRKELRNAVEEIRVELEQAMGKTTASDGSLKSQHSDVFEAVSTIRRNYATRVQQSEKRKQDLLAEILLEEQRGQDLGKIVKKLLPDAKNAADPEKPLRARKRSNDRCRMSKRLTEEAERYIEDFISNVEDSTDISSLDGERSDTSSSLGGMTRMETFQSPIALQKPPPVEMDGVVLPWLQWETSNDASPFSCNNKEPAVTRKTKSWDAVQDDPAVQEFSNRSISSYGSWSPVIIDGHSANKGGVTGGSKFPEVGSYPSDLSVSRNIGSQIDVDDYLKCQSEEEFLLQGWTQQHRIHSD